jgi:hypothetical protein
MATGDTRVVQNKKVMFVETGDVPNGIESAFDMLLSKCPGLMQREFFGVRFENKYWAAVELTDEDDPEKIGLQVGELPGGLYACKRLEHWNKETLSSNVPKTFREIVDGREVDLSRPFIEYYPSPDELILEAPVSEDEYH